MNIASMKRLAEVHPDLQRVISRAEELITEDGFGFVVTEGVRTNERQKELVAKGASQTMKSRHLTGHAVDLAVTVDGEVTWNWPVYAKLAKIVKEAAQIEGVPITWGGDWKMRDGPHFELTWKSYP